MFNEIWRGERDFFYDPELRTASTSKRRKSCTSRISPWSPIATT